MIQASVNQEKIQVINRTLILDLIRQEGTCSRAALARLSGLRQATITNIVGGLIHCGLVVETGLISGERNRRAIGVRLHDERFKVIGVRLTREMFELSLAGLSGKTYGCWEYRAEREEDFPAMLARVRAAIQKVVRENPAAEILSACVAVPGPYHKEEDRLLFVTGIDGWEGCPVRETLASGLPIPVYIVNDANAGVFAQFWYGCGDPAAQNMVYILAGQGIGCGMLVEGKLLLGQQRMAGELGHSSIQFNGPPCACGNRGCLETYCSLGTLRQQIAERLRGGADSCLCENGLTLSAISHAVRVGDRVACEAYRRACGFLAMGIAGLINQLNPGRIVIGDQLAEIHPGILLDVVQKNVSSSVNPLIARNTSIEVSRLHKNSSLLGAAAYAAHQELSNSERFLTASVRNINFQACSRELA